MKRVAACALVAGLAAFVAACGGGSGDSDVSQEDAAAIATQALFVLADFPTGWTEQPSSDDDDSSLDVDTSQLPEECQAFVTREDLEGTFAEIDSPEFLGPNEESVESTVTVFDDVETAEQAFSDIDTFFDECVEPLEEAFSEALTSLVQEDGDTEFGQIEVSDVRFDPLSFPEHGDGQVAFQFGATVGAGPISLDLEVDFVFIRTGRVAAALTFFTPGLGSDADEEERLAGIAEGRIREADGQLD